MMREIRMLVRDRVITHAQARELLGLQVRSPYGLAAQRRFLPRAEIQRQFEQIHAVMAARDEAKRKAQADNLVLFPREEL